MSTSFAVGETCRGMIREKTNTVKGAVSDC